MNLEPRLIDELHVCDAGVFFHERFPGMVRKSRDDFAFLQVFFRSTRSLRTNSLVHGSLT